MASSATQVSNFYILLSTFPFATLVLLPLLLPFFSFFGKPGLSGIDAQCHCQALQWVSSGQDAPGHITSLFSFFFGKPGLGGIDAQCHCQALQWVSSGQDAPGHVTSLLFSLVIICFFFFFPITLSSTDIHTPVATERKTLQSKGG